MRFLRVSGVVVMLCLAIGWVDRPAARTVAAVAPDGSGEQLSPSEKHQILGRAKAEYYARQRQLSQEAFDRAARNQDNYDVTFYEVTLRVDDTLDWLDGTVVFMARAAEDGVAEVEVNLYDNMTVDSIVGPGGALTYSRSADVVTVALGGVYNTGDAFTFDFHYQGQPEDNDAFTFGWHSGKRSISSMSCPYLCGVWWPCKDRNSDKPDSMKAHIEVDTSLFCASNGSLDSTTTDGGNSHIFHYTSHYPIATYLFCVTIHPYTVWEQDYVYNGDQDTMPIMHCVYDDMYSLSQANWGQSPQIMAILADAYGEYPFVKDKYGHANFEWGGGMEHQTITSMTGDSFGFDLDVVAHEMSHSWWGDMITCASWEDCWLNEGWATYSEAVYSKALGGWLGYHNYMNTLKYYGSGTIWVDDTTSFSRIFNGNLSYDKASWVVHMLRGVLGEDLFAQGVEAYYNSEFQYGAATTQDFIDVWEAGTGVELSAFIEDWIYGQYYPQYEYYFMYEPSDSGGNDVYLVVKQIQTTEPLTFHMPVDFFFDYDGMPDDTLQLDIQHRREAFRFNIPGTVNAIELDPAGWVLKTASNEPWEMFIITGEDDLAEGVVDVHYADTIEYRGGTGPNNCFVNGGALPSGLSINNQGIVSGVTSDTGWFWFSVNMYNLATGYRDQAGFNLYIGDCCVGDRGNVDCSSDNLVDMGDLTVLIDHLFISLNPLCCEDEANVDETGLVDMSDLTILIDHLFISLEPLPSCP